MNRFCEFFPPNPNNTGSDRKLVKMYVFFFFSLLEFLKAGKGNVSLDLYKTIRVKLKHVKDLDLDL